VDTLKQDIRVKFAGTHKMYYTDQVGGATPNDPRVNEQYSLGLMNMPLAWTLEKGRDSVIVVVVDSSFDTTHPDLKDRFFKTFNANDGTTDVSPSNNTDAHGTHVAGIASASTNNSVGIAGIAWQNTKLVGVKASTDGTGFTGASLLSAMTYVGQLRDQNPTAGIVCNMSLGSAAASDTPDLTDPFNIAILANANKSVVFALSAGNAGDTGNPPHSPSNLSSVHANVLCIAAVGQNGLRSTYSQSRPNTTVAAPGGDQSRDPGILSTVPVAQGSYAFFQGTSMATPNATGVIALLLSVPGVKAEQIKDVITSTARPVPGVPVPGSDYGYGLLDAFEALKKVSISVTIAEPTGTGGKATANGQIPTGDPVETTRPRIKIEVNQIAQANLTILIDQQQVTDYSIENVRSTGKDSNNNTIPLSYDVVIPKDANTPYAVGLDVLSPGQHRIDVTGVNSALPQAVTDFRNIFVTPHQFVAGRSMVSIPYVQTGALPETYLGANFKLARWLPDQARYVFYSSFGARDGEASFNPTGAVPVQDGVGTPVFPLGLAYWSDVETAKPIVTRGAALTDKPIVLPLIGNGTGDSRFVSWNMVGDPFPFDVPFSALLIDGPTGRISMAEATARGYVLPNIYTYDGGTGYTFRSLPDGVLKAWTGHWIGVTSKTNIKLVIPPARISRAAATRVASGQSGWKLRLGASVPGLTDTYNFLGVANEATDGYDLLDVPKPPLPSPYVNLGIRNDIQGRSVLMAQDMRSNGRNQKWTVVVDTDQKNSNVTVHWSTASLPKNVRLTIKDDVTGQVIDMRTRATTTFVTGETAAPRTFTVESRPGSSTVLRISNLAVRPGVGSRASGNTRINFTLSSDAAYEVTVMSAAGRPVGTVATRSAGTGDVNVVWAGRDQAGRAVPSGTYLLQVRAVNGDGEVVRAFQPFTLVR
jgi:thermitase